MDDSSRCPCFSVPLLAPEHERRGATVYRQVSALHGPRATLTTDSAEPEDRACWLSPPSTRSADGTEPLCGPGAAPVLGTQQ